MNAVIAIDPNIEIAPYQQIQEQVQAAIQRGDLEPGMLLPTVRQLADDLNVAPNTVARAYADLQAEGWVTSEGRRGTRVSERVPVADRRVRNNVLRETFERAIASLRGRGYSEGEILAEMRRLTS